MNPEQQDDVHALAINKKGVPIQCIIHNELATIPTLSNEYEIFFTEFFYKFSQIYIINATDLRNFIIFEK